MGSVVVVHRLSCSTATKWNLPDPEMKPESPALTGGFLTTGPPVFVVQLLSHVQLCDPMDCSMPGFPGLHYLLELGSDSYPFSWWCYLTISPTTALFSFYFQSFSASKSLPVSQLFISDGQSIGISASASVLPMNIQGWFPLGLTGLISLQSKGLSRIFSSTTIRKHQFFSTQHSLWSSYYICTWLLEKPWLWL